MKKESHYAYAKTYKNHVKNAHKRRVFLVHSLINKVWLK